MKIATAFDKNDEVDVSGHEEMEDESDVHDAESIYTRNKDPASVRVVRAPTARTYDDAMQLRTNKEGGSGPSIPDTLKRLPFDVEKYEKRVANRIGKKQITFQTKHTGDVDFSEKEKGKGKKAAKPTGKQSSGSRASPIMLDDSASS